MKASVFQPCKTQISVLNIFESIILYFCISLKLPRQLSILPLQLTHLKQDTLLDTNSSANPLSKVFLTFFTTLQLSGTAICQNIFYQIFEK